MSSSRLTFVLASLLGALAVHVSLAACASGTHVAGVFGSATPDAYADPTTPTAPSGPAAAPPCAKWEVRGFVPVVSTIHDDSVGHESFDAFSLPDGWEPISYGTHDTVLARRCVTP